MEKNWWGAKLEGAEMRKILRARLRRGGGETRDGRHKFTMHIIFKRNEKYSDPLSSPKLFLF